MDLRIEKPTQSSRTQAHPALDPLFSAVEIEINHSCNRRCSYCPNSILKRKATGEIDPDLFEKLLTNLREAGFKGRISYHFYNEPLLHSDFEGIVRSTRQKLPQNPIEVYTNGTLLSGPKLDQLLAAGVSRFIVTRHENEKNYLFEDIFLNLPKEKKDFITYQSFSDITLTNRGGILNHLGSSPVSLAPCYIPSLVLTVTVGGNVLPCFEDFHENLVMGNLKEQSLEEIWTSEKFTRFRKNLRQGQRHLYSPCQNCNRREVLPPHVL